MASSALLPGLILLVSLVLTMAGLGGGLVFSPLFVLLDMGKSQAASAALFLNGIAAASASYTYLRRGMVDFPVSLPLIISSTLAAPVGAWLNRQVDTRVFLLVMAAIVLLAALRMLLVKKSDAREKEIGSAARVAYGTVFGLAIGAAAGLLGIGGGVFVVPLLIFVLGMPAKTAAASSIFIVCFSSLSGFLGHAALIDLDWSFLLPAGAACVVGGQIGSRLMASRLRGRTVRLIFAVVLLLLCAKLLQRALF
jgi:hypothetical protein